MKTFSTGKKFNKAVHPSVLKSMSNAMCLCIDTNTYFKYLANNYIVVARGVIYSFNKCTFNTNEISVMMLDPGDTENKPPIFCSIPGILSEQKYIYNYVT